MESPQRNIVVALAFTVAFSLVGVEITHAQKGTNPVGSGSKILLGGAIGGTLLLGLSHVGEVGANFAQGLAIVSAATAILVEGGPVFSLISNMFGASKGAAVTPGSIPTGSVGSTSATSTTSPTTPTGG